MTIGIGRREFVTILGGAAVGPVVARAQQPRIPTIGVLGAATASSWTAWTDAFVRRLRELGWYEGRAVNIEYRWAEGRGDRASEIAAEFVRMKVDVILTSGVVTAFIKQATSSIPIVFATANDPVESGVVASLARPGGNVTGLSNIQADLASKRVELLREVIPGLRTLAIMFNAENPAAVLESREASAAARSLGLDVVTAQVRGAEDIAPAFESFREAVQALYICSDYFMFTHRMRINTFAHVARLATIYGEREQVEAGGLMSYGPNFADMFRRAAEYVDKILRGAKPSDLPVEQPTKFDLVVNLITAKAIGLTVPEIFLVRANEVIE